MILLLHILLLRGKFSLDTEAFDPKAKSMVFKKEMYYWEKVTKLIQKWQK